MSNIPSTTALLDACVLYPAPVRDILLNIATKRLFMPKWSGEIHNEWISNLHKNRPELNIERLKKTAAAMDSAFPDANVEDYETIMETLSLPDAGDRHVLAAAVKGEASVIVTENIKDFPIDELSKYGIEARKTDDFICDMLDLNKNKVLSAFTAQVKKLKSPPKTANDVLNTFIRCGLKNSANKIFALRNN